MSAQESPYPDPDDLPLLQAGEDLMTDLTTREVKDVIEMVQAASTFGFGAQVTSYWRTNLKATHGQSEMEWRVLVWREAAEYGRDEDVIERALLAEREAERHTKAEEQQRAEVTRRAAERTVRIVCPGVGTVVSLDPGPGRVDATRCPGCGADGVSVKRPPGALAGTGRVGRHAKHVLVGSPEAELTPYTGARKTKSSQGGVKTSSRPASKTRVATVEVRCPGSGKAVKLDLPTPPRCPSCKREDLVPPRFSPSSDFGLLAPHGKTVPASSKEASLARWEES